VLPERPGVKAVYRSQRELIRFVLAVAPWNLARMAQKVKNFMSQHMNHRFHPAQHFVAGD
jgi:hypothetical protein